ncbi:hypothetical protein NE236_16730 [Actinoallomurus purpureus]|uniref:hypothetical protein n=1 Tax=Actinoallomurus purpureus TaxID=478114 RepID=UPI0020939C27|nr:hypothetical protein [Actinoallomurus purpureus]MCO6006632.1 hypothetical protein [Actinoallomurus purpureus]
MTQPPPYPQQPSPGPYGGQPYQGGPQDHPQPYPGPQYPQQPYQGQQGQPPAQGGYQQAYPAGQGHQGPYPAGQGYQQAYQGQAAAYPGQPNAYQAQPQAYQGQPQAYQGQHAGYQQAPAGHPAPMGGPYAGDGLACRVCAATPAVKATFRGVVGAIVMHTIWTATGPFCRDCGQATFRKQTARTLAGGWCSIGALVLAPFFLLFNVIARGKVVNLPAPQRAAGGPAPLEPGKPVFQRPTAYVYPVIFFLFCMLLLIGILAR